MATATPTAWRAGFAAGLAVGVLVGLCMMLLAACDERPALAGEWAWARNDQIEVGVLRSAGAAIGWFSEPGGPNLVNRHDRGRLIQQSWYGDPDGSEWNGKPWVWNPVQGGDWRGTGARVLELRAGRGELYARSVARHWAACVELPDVEFEQWITLAGASAHVRYRMTYTGHHAHAPRHQEAPAVFCSPHLDTLVTAAGPRTPGWPGEYQPLPDGWAAWAGPGGGLRIDCPDSAELTCYRWAPGQPDGCSYLAPLLTLGVTPGAREYSITLTIWRP